MNDAKNQPRPLWFWLNLGALLILIPLGTILFQRHLKPYFTSIVLLGGVFTVWALVRLLWGIFEKASQFDAWDWSRRYLSSPGASRLLLVAALLLGFLWFTTTSLYFEASGGTASSYRVEVIEPASGRYFMDPVSISSTNSIGGAPRLLQFSKRSLQCRIVEPVGYDPVNFRLAPGEHKRLLVPREFPEKESHLLRLVPSGSLYRRLPEHEEPGSSNYAIELILDQRTPGQLPVSKRWDNLRRETVNVIPVTDAEQQFVKRLDNKQDYQDSLLTAFRAKGLAEEFGKQTAAVLVSHISDWPIAYLRKGDKISITIMKNPLPGDEATGAPLRSTKSYEVTAEKVQTIWLSDD
jgi:hypothetical protein